jgi:hypothetical protein
VTKVRPPELKQDAAPTTALQAEILPVFGRPAAIDTLMQQVPFVAMIDVASLYGTTPMVQ